MYITGDGVVNDWAGKIWRFANGAPSPVDKGRRAGVFHEAMENFIFHCPTEIVFGKKALAKVGRGLGLRNVQSVLLVSGQGSAKTSGVLETIQNSLRKHRVGWIDFPGARPNPVLSHAEQGVALARSHGVDAVLGVGGGSVMDTAKAIALGVMRDDLWNVFASGRDVLEALPVFTVPTISGSGSEASNVAVLTHGQSGEKLAVKGPALFPAASFVDPRVQASVGPHQAASCGADVFSHLMEQYVMGRDQETALALSEGLMRSVRECVPLVLENPEDHAARASLAWASILAMNGVAGAGFGGGDWTAHVLSHAVCGPLPHISHGQSLAVLLPAWADWALARKPAIFRRWARNVWNLEDPTEAVSFMRRMFVDWGLDQSLETLGVDRQVLPGLVQTACSHKPLGRLAPLERADVESILDRAWRG